MDANFYAPPPSYSPPLAFTYSMYAEAGDYGHTVSSALATSSDPGNHPSNDRSTVAIVSRPVGSGINGPAAADFGLTISSIKSNWTSLTASQFGEMDALNIVVRQGGPTATSSANRSDCAAILANVQNMAGTGYAAAFEADVGNITTSFVQNRELHVYAGTIDGVADQSYGFVANALVGPLTCGFLLQEQGTSTWGALLTYRKATGTVAFQIDNEGNVLTEGCFAGTVVKSYGTQVVGQQITGYGTPTGGTRLANFPGATATLAQTSAALAQLIADLKTHGLLGA